MKKNAIRIISFILLAIMMLSAAACAETPENPDAGSSSPDASQNAGPAATTVPDTPDETTAVNAENILGPRDFGNKTLTFYSRKYNGAWSSDLMAEEQNGTVLNDAIYKRNSKINEYYHIKLEEIESGKQSFQSDAENRIKTDDTSYQVLYMGLAEAAKMAIAGYLLDMQEISNINLEGEWWTQSSNDAWSIGKGQYFATGDITTTDDMAIRCMYFNKDILANLQLKSIYDLVNDNEWVYEKFFEYVEAAKKDDGDGVVTMSDTFGATAQVTFGFMMTMGSGEMLVKKDADNVPQLAVNEDNVRFVDVVTYLTDKISNNSGIYLGADADIMSIFTNGQSLFLAEVLLHAQTMRVNYDVNFGIIPMPKYTADQENYYQYTTGYCTTVICFPTSTRGDDLDMSSFVVEAMAIESVETVTPAYYDICLKGRYADDVESAYMLDIITASVSSDLAEIYSWGGFKTTVQDAISSGMSISSVIKKNAPLTQKAITKALENFLNNQ